MPLKAGSHTMKSGKAISSDSWFYNTGLTLAYGKEIVFAFPSIIPEISASMESSERSS
jgi:hypothetical protein